MRIFYGPVTSLFSGRPDPVVVQQPAPAAPDPEPPETPAETGRNIRRRRARSTLLTEQQRDAGGRTTLLGG
jgi:hypothetical protein